MPARVGLLTVWAGGSSGTSHFSDEKRFNFGGPDGCQYYWHDSQKKRRLFYSQHSEGGSIMVWAAIFWKGKTPLSIANGILNRKQYTALLERFMLPFAHSKVGTKRKDSIIMQDNGSVHSARHCKKGLEGRKANLLTWPELSPDLHPIDNVWWALANFVYANERRFNSVADLTHVGH